MCLRFSACRSSYFLLAAVVYDPSTKRNDSPKPGTGQQLDQLRSEHSWVAAEVGSTSAAAPCLAKINESKLRKLDGFSVLRFFDSVVVECIYIRHSKLRRNCSTREKRASLRRSVQVDRQRGQSCVFSPPQTIRKKSIRRSNNLVRRSGIENIDLTLWRRESVPKSSISSPHRTSQDSGEALSERAASWK